MGATTPIRQSVTIGWVEQGETGPLLTGQCVVQLAGFDMESGQRPDGTPPGSRRAVRVLVACATGAARSSIVTELEADGFDVCGTPGGVDTAVERVGAEAPDLALLQSDQPAASVAAAREILLRDSHVAVVILDEHLDDDLLFGALDAGASGVLPFDVDPARLPHILRGVLAGEAAIPRATMTRVVREFGARARGSTGADGQPLLTRRQHQVLELLALGMTTSEIATSLYISRVTVRTHVFAILHQLELPDRAAAVEYFSASR